MNRNNDDRILELAEKIRGYCIHSAREGFREASLSGLCTEGAIEAAIGAMQSIDLEQLVKETFPRNRS